MPKRKITVALMYDFDKTLSPSNMQEYGFIPDVGMSPKEFWECCDAMARDHGMDRILTYMYMMLNRAEGRTRITKDAFVMRGREVALFPGVESWFDRVDAYAKSRGLSVEHYCVSSGLEEIISGTPIAPKFRKIFASRFYYDVNDVARWPALAVGYTTKTQFLYRINKGVLDISDDEGVNAYMPATERPVPFPRMVYIGDGYSDVPCMKLVKGGGGHSIGVYWRDQGVIRDLTAQGRLSFAARADYSEGKPLEQIVFGILDHIAAREHLADWAVGS